MIRDEVIRQKELATQIAAAREEVNEASAVLESKMKVLEELLAKADALEQKTATRH